VACELATGQHDGRFGPLDLDGELLVVDTTESIDVRGLVARVRAAAAT
jgi:hypothetical protein